MRLELMGHSLRLFSPRKLRRRAQCYLEFAERLRRPAGLPVRQTELRAKGCMVGSRSNSIGQSRKCFLKPPLAVVNPAQRMTDLRTSPESCMRDERQAQRIVELSISLLDPCEVVRGDGRGRMARKDLFVLPPRLIAARQRFQNLRNEGSGCRRRILPRWTPKTGN